MTIALNGTINAANLAFNFDERTATLNTNALRITAGADFDWNMAKRSVSTVVRSWATRAADSYELRALRITVRHTAAAVVVRASLTVADNPLQTRFLQDVAVATTVTSINGTISATADFRTVTGDRVRLLRGVRYRLNLWTDAGTVNFAQAIAVVRSIRRRG